MFVLNDWLREFLCLRLLIALNWSVSQAIVLQILPLLNSLYETIITRVQDILNKILTTSAALQCQSEATDAMLLCYKMYLSLLVQLEYNVWLFQFLF